MDEEIVSLKFVADDASVLDSVERVGEKITDLNEKSKSLFNTGEGQPSQMTNPFMQKVSNWSSELDNILRARKQIDTAMSDVDRQDATAKYERKIEVANKTISDLAKSKTLTDGLVDEFGTAFTDGLTGIVSKLSAGMRKAALNLSKKAGGPVSDEAIIKAFETSDDYKAAIAPLRQQDRRLFTNKNAAQYLQGIMPIAVPQYTRSAIVGGSHVAYRETPKTFRDLLPKSFQAIPAYRPEVVGKAGSTEAARIPLTEAEAKDLRDIIQRDRYAADAAVAAGLFTKRNRSYIYNPASNREMVNIMAGYSMDDIVTGAQGERKYGIRNVEDESSFRNIVKKVGNNASLDHGLFSARALDSKFEWLNPVYLEGERYNPAPGEGVFAGRIKHGPRKTSRAFAEYSLAMMEAGAQVSGNHPLYQDENGNWVQLPNITRPTTRADAKKAGIHRAITPDDWHTISLSNSMLQELVEGTPSASKVGHNGFSDNMIYLKYDDELSNPMLSNEDREKYIQRYANLFRNGYRANGIDYISTRIGKTHAEFMNKAVVADIGRKALGYSMDSPMTDEVIQEGLKVLTNGGGLGEYKDFKPFAKSLYNQNLIATEGENLRDWLGTKFGFTEDGSPNMKVVVGKFGEKDMDGANLINSIISSEGFQGRTYGGKATYVPINMSGFRKLNYKQIEGNEETTRRIEELNNQTTRQIEALNRSASERTARVNKGEANEEWRTRRLNEIETERAARESQLLSAQRSREAAIMDQYGGDLIIRKAGLYGGDLRVGKDVDVIEDYNNIKNKELLANAKTQEQANAIRSGDYSRLGIFAKTTYDAAGTSSRWLSKQLVNSSMNAGFRDPEVASYFGKIFFNEIAKLDDDQYVRDLLFNGDQSVNLNSPEARRTIQNHINGMWSRYNEGDRLLPTGVYSYAMAAPNVQSVVNNRLRDAGIELTEEQKALELEDHDVISRESLEKQLGIVRFPATKGGYISAANMVNDKTKGYKVKRLADQLGMDPKGLYFKPDSQILKLLQGEDFDGDINGMFGLTGKADPEFSRIMQKVAELGQQEYERIQEIAAQTSAKSRHGGVISGPERSTGYHITNPYDKAMYLVQGQRDSALMGMAERSADMSALLGAGVVDPVVARAILDYEEMYDTVSTHMKTAEEWKLTDQQVRASKMGRSFSNIFKYANDAIQTFGANDSSEQRWTKDSADYFAEKNIDKLNLPSIFQGSIIGTLIGRMKEAKRGGNPNGIGMMGEEIVPWDLIFKDLDDAAPLDLSTESGKMAAAMRGVKRDILTSKYLISSQEDVDALSVQAQKAEQEILQQMTSFQGTDLERAKRLDELKDKAGLNTFDNFKQFGLTEENYKNSPWLKDFVDKAASDANVPVSEFFSKQKTAEPTIHPQVDQPQVEQQKPEQPVQKPEVTVTKTNTVPPIPTERKQQQVESAKEEARRLLVEAGVKKSSVVESLLNMPGTQLQEIVNTNNIKALLGMKDVGPKTAPKIISALSGSRLAQIETTPVGPGMANVGSVPIPQVENKPVTDRMVECPVCGTLYPESAGSCPNSANHSKIQEQQKAYQLSQSGTSGTGGKDPLKTYEATIAQGAYKELTEGAREYSKRLYGEFMLSERKYEGVPKSLATFDRNLGIARAYEQKIDKFKRSSSYTHLSDEQKEELDKLISPENGLIAMAGKDFSATSKFSSGELLKSITKAAEKSDSAYDSQIAALEQWDEKIKEVAADQKKLLEMANDPSIAKNLKQRYKKDAAEIGENLKEITSARADIEENIYKDKEKRLGLVQQTSAEKAEQWKTERLNVLDKRRQLALSRMQNLENDPASTLYQRQAAEREYNAAEEAYRTKGDAVRQQAADMQARAERIEEEQYNAFVRSITGDQLSDKEARGLQIDQTREKVQSYRDQYAPGSAKWNKWNDRLNDTAFWNQYNEDLKVEQAADATLRQNQLQAVDMMNANRLEQTQRQAEYAQRNFDRQRMMYRAPSALLRSYQPYLQRREMLQQQIDSLVGDNGQIKIAELRRDDAYTKLMSIREVRKATAGKSDDQIKEFLKTYQPKGKAATGALANFKSAQGEVDRLNASLKASQDSLSQTGGIGSAAFDAITSSLSRLVSRLGHQMFRRALAEAKKFVQEFNATMTEIQMITLKTNDQMSTLGDGLIDKAKELKISISEITKSAATLYRQGLSDEEVNERLDVISKFSKVSGTKVEDATKLITVAMNTGLVTDPTMAADIVTALGDSAATNAAQIEKGIEKAGAAAASDGTTFGQLAAMLTAITSTTQIGGNVAGRTLNTIMGRMNKIGTNELIYDENGNAVSGSAVAQLLEAQGISMYENGNKRSTFDTLYSLSQKWEGMSDAEQQQIANAIAGTRMYSNFAAIMQGMSEGDIDKYMDLIGESSGITDKKFDIYTESLQASLTELRNTFDGLIADLTKSGALQGVVEQITTMIQGVDNLTGSLGNLSGVLPIILAMFGALQGMKIGSLFGGPGAVIGGILGAIAMPAAFQGLVNAGSVKTAEQRFNENNARYTEQKELRAGSINRLKELKANKNRTSEENTEYVALINRLADWYGMTNDSAGSATYSIENLSSAIDKLSGSADDAAGNVIKQADENEKQKWAQNISSGRIDTIETLEGDMETAAKGRKSVSDINNPFFNGDIWYYDETYNDGEGGYRLKDDALSKLKSLSASASNADDWFGLSGAYLRWIGKDVPSFNGELKEPATKMFMQAASVGLMDSFEPNAAEVTEDEWALRLKNGAITQQELEAAFNYVNSYAPSSPTAQRDDAKQVFRARFGELLGNMYTSDQIDYLAEYAAGQYVKNGGNITQAFNSVFGTGTNYADITQSINKALEGYYVEPNPYQKYNLENPGETGYFYDENRTEYISGKEASKQVEEYNKAIETDTRGKSIRDAETFAELGTYYARNYGSLEKATTEAEKQRRFYYTDQNGNRVYTDKNGNWLETREDAQIEAGRYMMNDAQWTAKYYDYVLGKYVSQTGTREQARAAAEASRQQSLQYAFGVSSGMEDLTGYSMSQEEAEAFARVYNWKELERYERDLAKAYKEQNEASTFSYRDLYGNEIVGRGLASKGFLENRRQKEIDDNYYVLRDGQGNIVKTFSRDQEQVAAQYVFDNTAHYLNDGSGELLGYGQAGLDEYERRKQDNWVYTINGTRVGRGEEAQDMFDMVKAEQYEYKGKRFATYEEAEAEKVADEAARRAEAEATLQKEAERFKKSIYDRAPEFYDIDSSYFDSMDYKKQLNAYLQGFRKDIETYDISKVNWDIGKEYLDDVGYYSVETLSKETADKIISSKVFENIPELANVEPARIAEVYGRLPEEVKVIIDKIAETGEATLEELDAVQEAVANIQLPKLKAIHNRFNGAAAFGYSAWKQDTKNANGLVADRVIRDIMSGQASGELNLEGSNALQNLVDFLNVKDNKDWEQLTRIVPELGRLASQIQLDESGRIISSSPYALQNLMSVLYGTSHDYGAYAFSTTEKGEMARSAYDLIKNRNAVSYEDALSRVDATYDELYQSPYDEYTKSLGSMSKEMREQAQKTWKEQNKYISRSDYRKQALKDIPYFNELEEGFLKEALGEDFANSLIQGKDNITDAEAMYANMLLENYSLGRTNLTAEQRLQGLQMIRGMNASEYKEFAGSTTGAKAISQFTKGLSDYTEYNALRLKAPESLTDEEKTKLETFEKNIDEIQKNAEIEVKIENLKALEQAGDVAEGTATAFEKLAKGGKEAADALNELNVKGFESGQQRAKLYNGTALQQDEAAMAYLGMSADQYYANREGNLRAAKEYEELTRTADARAWDELLEGAPTDEDRNRIIDIARRSGFDLQQNVESYYDRGAVKSRYVNKFAYAGAGNVTNEHPLAGKQREYTEYELAQARQDIMNGVLTESSNPELYNAAVQSGGHYFTEYQRRYKAQDFAGASEIEDQARTETANGVVDAEEQKLKEEFDLKEDRRIRERSSELAKNLATLRTGNAAEVLSLLSGFGANARNAQNAQYALQNGALPESASTLASFLNMDEKDVKKSLASDQGKAQLQKAITDQTKSLYKFLAESVGVDMSSITDESSLADVKALLLEAAENTKGEAKEFLENLASSIGNAGDLIGQADKTFTDNYNEIMDQFGQTASKTKAIDWLKGNFATVASSPMTYSVADQYGNITQQEYTLPEKLQIRAAEAGINLGTITDPSIIAAMNMYGNGLSEQGVYDLFDYAYSGREKDYNYYDIIGRSMFGNFMDQNGNFNINSANSDAFLQQYTDLFESMDGSRVVLDELIQKYPELSEVVAALKDPSKDSEKAIKKLNEQIDDDKAADIAKYTKDNGALASALSKLKKGGKDAAEGMAMLRKQAEGYQDQMTAVNKASGKSGKQLDKQTLSVIDEMFEGLDSDDIKQMTETELQDLLSDVPETINENFTEVLQGMWDDAIAQAQAIDPHFDLSQITLNADGTPNLSQLDSAVAAILADVWNKMQALAGTLGEAHLETMNGEDFIKVVGSVFGKNKYNRGGGGGGGGGKSATDKLLEQQKHKLSDVNHQIKMTQIDEAHYQRMNDSTNYFDSLDREIGLQQSLGELYQSNIAEMQAQLAQTKVGSDDWKKLTEAIWEAEEAYAAIGDTIEDVNAKRLAQIQKDQQYTDSKEDYTTSMWGIYAQRFLSQDRYADYENAITEQINATRSSIRTNNEQISELEGELGNYVEGSDEFRQIEQNIMEIKKDSAQKENEAIQLQLELDRQRLAQISTYLQRTSASAQHNINMAQTYGQAYSAAGFNAEYRGMMERQLADYDGLIEANTRARDSAIATMNSLIAGSPVWFEARDAVYQYEEAVAQATTAQLELQRAMQELDLQTLADAYGDATRPINQNRKLIADLKQEFYDTNDFEAYHEAIRMDITQQNNLLEEERAAAAKLREYIANNELDPTMRRQAEDQLYNYEANISSITHEINAAVRELEKSNIDTLIEKMERRAAEYDHNLKLIQYQETKYQNSEQLTNYGIMLGHETDLRKANAAALEDEINTLERQLPALEDNQKEYIAVVEQIRKKEEQLKAENNQIEKNTKLLEENTKKIIQVKKAVEDDLDKAIREQIKKEREQLAARVNLQNTVFEVIRRNKLREWELEKKTLNLQKQNLNEEKALISERLNARKKASDEAEKYEELAEYRRQLALINADPTRTKDAKELRRRIQDLEKQIGWTIAEEEAQAQQEGLDNQMKSIDDYMVVTEENLNEMLSDANNFADQINGLLMGEYSEFADWMKQNNETIKNSLGEAQQQTLTSWEDTWKTMRDIYDTYWTEVGQLMITEDEYVERMKQTDEYRRANDETGKRLLEMQYRERYRAYTQSTVVSDEAVNWQLHDHDIPEVVSHIEELEKINTDIYGLIKEAYQFSPWRTWEANAGDKSTGERPNFGVDYTGWGRTEDIHSSYSYSASDYEPADSGSGGGGGGSGAGQKYGYKFTYNGKIYDSGKIYKTKSEALTYGESRKADLIAGFRDAGRYQEISKVSGVNTYLHGGLVDYTGPAWVDGTKKRPEAFLDAYDTESIRSMLDAFKYIRQKPFMSSIDPAFFKGNNTSMGDFNVTINVEHLDSEADYDEIASKVGEAFTKQLRKEGLNLAGYAF